MENIKIIKWDCVYCGKENHTEMHTDPDEHYVSMVCAHCEEETEGCFCENIGAPTGKKRSGGSQFVEIELTKPPRKFRKKIGSRGFSVKCNYQIVF